MLYVTTRIGRDAFTAHRALTENRGPEGGLYLPMRMAELTAEQILEMENKSFGQNVADVMNLLFNTDLDGWAIEFAIGRYPVRMVRLSGKVTVAESWHNPDWQFDRLVRNLAKTLLQSNDDEEPSSWMMIAARIAVICGVYGDLLHSGQMKRGVPFDIVVPGGDFSAPMAAYYARQWGIPIGNIVICCNENNASWGLLHQGELRTDTVSIRTKLPKCDHAVPENLERFIYSVLGAAEAKHFCDAHRRGEPYYLQPAQLQRLRQGINVSVISQHRTELMISGIYKNNGYIPDPYTAFAYSGLMDYRSITGESRPALILAEESPAFYLGMISSCLGISQRELKERINRS